MPPCLLKPSTTRGQQVPKQDLPRKFSSNTGTQPWASIYRQLKLLQNHRPLITHYWTLHCTPERRNPAPPTRTPTQASLPKKPWQATDTTPPTVRKLHNKENSTNCQNTERPPQTQICRWHHPYGRKWRGTKKLLDESERGEWKVGLKLNIQKTKIMASSPITSWQIGGETLETVSDFIFWGPKSLQMVIAAMKLKDAYSLEEKLWPT